MIFILLKSKQLGPFKSLNVPQKFIVINLYLFELLNEVVNPFLKWFDLHMK